jgi:DNA adenine methylase
MSFFRYPGGKSKLRNQIAAKLNDVASTADLEYREPFFGGGSIGLKLLQDKLDLKRMWINDFDPGISCLWTTLINRPDLLKDRVMKFTPSIEAFYKYKEELTSTQPEFTSDTIIANYGFKKLAIHQISYSGLGTKSGGPLGGEKQISDYKIDCRWSPTYICNKIDLLHKRFSQLSIRDGKCTNLDFASLILDEQYDAVIYLDPPYFDKGNDLYQFSFNAEDHHRLSTALKETKHQWVLSYDDCKEIRELYEWANIEEIKEVSYSITALKDKKTGERLSRTKCELLIMSKFISNTIRKEIVNVSSNFDCTTTGCEAVV